MAPSTERLASQRDGEYQPRTYGNWRRPDRPGLGKLGMVGTAVLFAGIVVSALTWLVAGWIASIPLVVLLIIFLSLVAIRDRHGRSLLQRLTTRLRWWRVRASGENLYRSGPLGRTGWGTHQLPGLAARTTLTERTDAYGRPFGIVSIPATATHAVSISCTPDGDSLVDHSQYDKWAAGYAAFLKMLGQEPGLVAGSLTIETAPDSGARLRREIGNRIDPNAPEVAREVLAEMVERYPIGSAHITGTATLTFEARTPGGKARSLDEVGDDLASRLPAMVEQLSAAGAGSTRPLSAQRLCEQIRVAYEPSAQALIDESYADDQVPPLDWSDIGPSGAEAMWSCYRHDSAWSVTWEMTMPPRGNTYANILARLLAPHPAIARKRVTLLYRPYDYARAGEMVERDLNYAQFISTQKGRPSARHLTMKRAAEATAAEEAQGAGLVDVGMLVTATVTDRDQLDEAVSAMSYLAGGAHLQIRPVHGSQDSAFAAALPLGLVLPKHMTLPAPIRESL